MLRNVIGNGRLVDSPLIIFLLQALHVLGNVTTVDVLLQHLSIKGFALRVVAGETLLGVGDEDTTIAGTLHGTEDTRTGRSPLQTDVEVALEGSGSVLLIKNLRKLQGAIGLRDTFVLVGQSQLGQCTTSAQKTSRVR